MARYGKATKKKTGKKYPTVPKAPKQSKGPIFDPIKFAPDAHKANKIGKKKPITTEDMAAMGFTNTEVTMMEDMAAIKSLSPYMAVARCTKTMRFAKGGEKAHFQTLQKGDVYVMALGMYDTLRYAPAVGRDVLKPYKRNFAEVFNRYEGQNLDGKTVLIWRTGGIGDLLFIKPNMDEMKRRWPTCKIWFACAPSYQNMVKHWPEVDKLVDLPIDYQKIFSKADYHVTFEGAIERNNQAHTLNAYDMFSQWMGLNLEGDQLIPKQEPPKALLPACEQVLMKWGLDPQGKDFILGQMQPSSPIRAIDQNKWIALYDELTDRGHNIVITDSPMKSAMVDLLIKGCKNPDKMFNFAKHSETLDYTIALCSLSKATVGPDSSLTHIAASLDVPCFGIFGPFVGEIRMSHFKNADWINCSRDCAPCFLHGNDPCPQAGANGISPCLNNWDAIEVADRIVKLLT